MLYQNLPITEFADELAAASAAPGGGSAAALSGALGAALVGMVCRVTMGRKNYENVSAEFERLLPRADALRAELLGLIQQDAEAYLQVMSAYQLPKDTEQDKVERTRAIQDALKRAAEVPLHIAQACAEVVQMSEATAARGNKNATSDAGAGALMAESGLRAAILNVEINLGLIRDDAFQARLRAELEPLKRVAQKRAAILDLVQARI